VIVETRQSAGPHYVAIALMISGVSEVTFLSGGLVEIRLRFFAVLSRRPDDHAAGANLFRFCFWNGGKP